MTDSTGVEFRSLHDGEVPVASPNRAIRGSTGPRRLRIIQETRVFRP